MEGNNNTQNESRKNLNIRQFQGQEANAATRQTGILETNVSNIKNKIGGLGDQKKYSASRIKEISKILGNYKNSIKSENVALKNLEKALEKQERKQSRAGNVSYLKNEQRQIGIDTLKDLIEIRKSGINSIEKNRDDLQGEQEVMLNFLKSIPEEIDVLTKQFKDQSTLLKQEKKQLNKRISKEKGPIKQNFLLEKVERAQAALQGEARNVDDIKRKIQEIQNNQQELSNQLITAKQIIQDGPTIKNKLKKEYASVTKETSNTLKNLDKLLKKQGKLVDSSRKGDIEKLEQTTKSIQELRKTISDLNSKSHNIKENQIAQERNIRVAKQDKNTVPLQQANLARELNVINKRLKSANKDLSNLTKQYNNVNQNYNKKYNIILDEIKDVDDKVKSAKSNLVSEPNLASKSDLNTKIGEKRLKRPAPQPPLPSNSTGQVMPRNAAPPAPPLPSNSTGQVRPRNAAPPAPPLPSNSTGQVRPRNAAPPAPPLPSNSTGQVMPRNAVPPAPPLPSNSTGQVRPRNAAPPAPPLPNNSTGQVMPRSAVPPAPPLPSNSTGQVRPRNAAPPAPPLPNNSTGQVMPRSAVPPAPPLPNQGLGNGNVVAEEKVSSKINSSTKLEPSSSDEVKHSVPELLLNHLTPDALTAASRNLKKVSKKNVDESSVGSKINRSVHNVLPEDLVAKREKLKSAFDRPIGEVYNKPITYKDILSDALSKMRPYIDNNDDDKDNNIDDSEWDDKDHNIYGYEQNDLEKKDSTPSLNTKLLDDAKDLGSKIKAQGSSIDLSNSNEALKHSLPMPSSDKSSDRGRG